MENNSDAIVYIGLALIGLILAWRYIILPVIAMTSRRLYIWINEITSPIPITPEYRKGGYKAYKKAKKTHDEEE